ncbi:MAG: DUF4294 domain-containing protein [Bacteroidaceae bacterium]
MRAKKTYYFRIHFMKALILFFVGLTFGGAAFSQTVPNVDSLRVPLYVHVGKILYKGDSIPNIKLPTLHVFPAPSFRNESERRRYTRLVVNVKRTLPLAKLAKQTLIETYDVLETLPNKRARDLHIKLVEKGMKQQYTPMVKKLSFTQGKVLVKLIDRECGQSSYDMVNAFLGSFRAGFYNVLAGLFGNSLKKRYEPEGEDREMERIVLMVESGQM